ncbi:MAG: hypothetical protein HOA08_16165 [Rhodospirillaceae bacterium]|nr:hypothetical protein [Rhodospirillaceae bacterium]MBT6263067.1 hypothetical protein [Rhodospirillaceae bacterium]MBT6976463.1 hypothetical protein [Rhodospirillaceae bacterium]
MKEFEWAFTMLLARFFGGTTMHLPEQFGQLAVIEGLEFGRLENVFNDLRGLADRAVMDIAFGEMPS